MIGNGGHSKVIQDMISAIAGHEIIAILDDKYVSCNQTNGVIYAPLSFAEKLLEQDTKVVIAIGDNVIRKKLTERLGLATNQYVTIIHPTAVVSPTAEIGNGTVVMPRAVINVGTIIGIHCIINTGAIIEHENKLGDFTHISPHATLTGNVAIGTGVHVGAAATAIPGMTVGDWSIIGAGSTIIRPIPANSKAVGSPARLVGDHGKQISKDRVVMLYDK